MDDGCDGCIIKFNFVAAEQVLDVDVPDGKVRGTVVHVGDEGERADPAPRFPADAVDLPDPAVVLRGEGKQDLLDAVLTYQARDVGQVTLHFDAADEGAFKLWIIVHDDPWPKQLFWVVDQPADQDRA